MIDYHIHTDLSLDSKTHMADIAAAAHKKGLKEICITEHVDFDFPNLGDFLVDFNLYTQQLEEIKAAYPDMNIRKGIEAGIDMKSHKRIGEYLFDKKLDYIIGSVHVVFNSDPYFPEFWQNVSKQEAFDEYARVCLERVKAADFFDVFGHLGYISKYCPHEDNLFAYDDYADMIDEMLLVLISRGKGLEVNTSGLIKTGNLIPELAIIQQFKRLGGEIVTVGSDAHVAENVGYAAQYALDALKTLGFKYVCAYDQRVPRFILIP